MKELFEKLQTKLSRRQLFLIAALIFIIITIAVIILNVKPDGIITVADTPSDISATTDATTTTKTVIYSGSIPTSAVLSSTTTPEPVTVIPNSTAFSSDKSSKATVKASSKQTQKATQKATVKPTKTTAKATVKKTTAKATTKKTVKTTYRPATVTVTVTQRTTTTPPLMGDMNFDGKLNKADYNILSDIVNGKKQSNLKYRIYGDLNGDGKLTVVDCRILYSMIWGD